MDKKDLYKLLHDKEEEFERAKHKRAIKILLALSVVIFAIMYFREKPRSVTEIAGMLLVAIFLAGIDFWVHSIIFIQLFEKSTTENNILENIRKEIKKLDSDQQ